MALHLLYLGSFCISSANVDEYFVRLPCRTCYFLVLFRLAPFWGENLTVVPAKAAVYGSGERAVGCAGAAAGGRHGF